MLNRLLSIALTCVATSALALDNPAYLHCQNLINHGDAKYYVVIEDDNNNEYGICVFPDLSYCGQWDLLRGHCVAGDLYWPEYTVPLDDLSRYSIVVESGRVIVVL